MVYQRKSCTFEDRNNTHRKIKVYLAEKGIGELGNCYSRKVCASELATVVVEYNRKTFTTKIDVGTENQEFLEDLVNSFPQIELK